LDCTNHENWQQQKKKKKKRENQINDKFVATKRTRRRFSQSGRDAVGGPLYHWKQFSYLIVG